MSVSKFVSKKYLGENHKDEIAEIPDERPNWVKVIVDSILTYLDNNPDFAGHVQINNHWGQGDIMADRCSSSSNQRNVTVSKYSKRSQYAICLLTLVLVIAMAVKLYLGTVNVNYIE
jgi:hypothetical protein